MKRLTPFSHLTADFYHYEKGATTAVWLPKKLRPEGILRVTGNSCSPKPYEPLGWIANLEQFQDETGLSAVLGYIGISAEVNGREGEMRFPRIETIAKRIAALNRQLPVEHTLPKVSVVPGGIADELLCAQLLKEDSVIVADGTGRKTAPDNPIIAAHDLAYHLAPRLAMGPSSREIVADQIAIMMDLPTRDLDGQTPYGRYLRAADTALAAPILSAEKFLPGDVRPRRHTPGAADALYELSNAVHEIGGETAASMQPEPKDCVRLGQLDIEHVRYVAENIAAARNPLI